MTAEQVLEVARSFIGYHEKNGPAELDELTAGAGSGNYTRFARDLDAVRNFYNGPKQGFAWCDVYVDAVMYYASGEDAEKTMYTLCQPERSCGAGCEFSARYYKAAGRWSETPVVGAQVFFSWQEGVVGHTGLVERVENGYIVTIEGNTSDQVARRRYPITSPNIYGYGLPRYDEAQEKTLPDVGNAVTLKAGAGVYFRPEPSMGNDVFCLADAGEARVVAVLDGATRPVLVLMGDLCGWVEEDSLAEIASDSGGEGEDAQEKNVGREHVVVEGDCLWDIGQLYGVTPWQIAEANGMPSIYVTIHPGDTLKIP